MNNKHVARIRTWIPHCVFVTTFFCRCCEIVARLNAFICISDRIEVIAINLSLPLEWRAYTLRTHTCDFQCMTQRVFHCRQQQNYKQKTEKNQNKAKRNVFLRALYKWHSQRVDEKSLRKKRLAKKCWHIRRFLIGTLEEKWKVFFSILKRIASILLDIDMHSFVSFQYSEMKIKTKINWKWSECEWKKGGSICNTEWIKHTQTFIRRNPASNQEWSGKNGKKRHE